MDRRTYLLTAAGTGSCLAGCAELVGESDGGDGSADESDDETEPEDGGISVPAWAEWLPADALAEGSDADVAVLDVDGAEAFPPEFDISQPFRELASTLGIREGAMDTIAFVLRDVGPESSVIPGDYDPEAILAEADVSDSEVEQYRGMTVVDDFMGVSESALVFGDNFRRLIDTRYGDVRSLATERGAWGRLYAAFGEWAFATMTDRYYGDSIPYDVSMSAVTIEPLEERRALLSGFILFATPETAERAYEDGRDEIVAEAREDENTTLQNIDRTDRIISFTAETSDIEGILSETGPRL